MIPITKGMLVPDAPSLVVVTEDGRYGDFDLIQCADISDSVSNTCAYQAQFIRYGKLVYQFQTPEELGAAIVAIDPESTHDAAQLWREELARKLARDSGTLTPENPIPAPDATDPTESTRPADAPEPDAQAEIFDADPNDILSTPDATLPEVPDASFVEHAEIPDTPPTDVPVNPPAPVDDVLLDEATSTPAIDLSTTTPE